MKTYQKYIKLVLAYSALVFWLLSGNTNSFCAAQGELRSTCKYIDHKDSETVDANYSIPINAYTNNPKYLNTIKTMTAYITNVMANSGLPSVSIGLVDNQQLVWAAGFGYANLSNHTPAKASTLYPVASIGC